MDNRSRTQLEALPELPAAGEDAREIATPSRGFGIAEVTRRGRRDFVSLIFRPTIPTLDEAKCKSLRRILSFGLHAYANVCDGAGSVVDSRQFGGSWRTTRTRRGKLARVSRHGIRIASVPTELTERRRWNRIQSRNRA